MNKKQTMSLIIVLAVVVIGGSLITTYNRLVRLENEVDTSWSQVENVMQRRADLIPNLVNSVQGSMKQEQKVFGDIAAARSAYQEANTPEEKIEANNELTEQIGTMINVINERYPELKSNEQVETLMVQLEGTENRIAVERKQYIDTVNRYNQEIRTFPNNLMAGLLGFHKKANFEAQKGADQAPVVQFE